MTLLLSSDTWATVEHSSRDVRWSQLDCEVGPRMGVLVPLVPGIAAAITSLHLGGCRHTGTWWSARGSEVPPESRRARCGGPSLH